MSKQKFMFVTNATFLSKYLLPLTVLNEGTFFFNNLYLLLSVKVNKLQTKMHDFFM